MRIDHRRIQNRAGIRNHRHLHAGTNARVQTDHTLMTSWSGQKQILQIGTENANSLCFGTLAQASKQIPLNGSQTLNAPAPAHNTCQPNVSRASQVFDAVGTRNEFLTRMHGKRFLFLSKKHLYRQKPFLTAAEHSKRSVRRHGFDRFIVVKIVAVLGCCRISLLFRHNLAHQIRLLPEEFAQFFEHIGVFIENFSQDVPSTVKCSTYVGHPLVRVDKCLGFRFGIAQRVFPQ